MFKARSAFLTHHPQSPLFATVTTLENNRELQWFAREMLPDMAFPSFFSPRFHPQWIQQHDDRIFLVIHIIFFPQVKIHKAKFQV